jgi:hypothetical protein
MAHLVPDLRGLAGQIASPRHGEFLLFNGPARIGVGTNEILLVLETADV